MAFLAGSSLDVGTNSVIVKKAHEIARNIRKLSSFDIEYIVEFIKKNIKLTQKVI